MHTHISMSISIHTHTPLCMPTHTYMRKRIQYGKLFCYVSLYESIASSEMKKIAL